MRMKKTLFPTRFQCGFSEAQNAYLESLIIKGRFENKRQAVRWCVSRAMTYEVLDVDRPHVLAERRRSPTEARQ